MTSEHSIHLGNRLRLCAAYVRPQAALCDVGTDHAYLPIWLQQQSRIHCALACDVRSGPLESAKTNIAKFHLQDHIQTRLSDGLAAVQQAEAEDFVIAGMGGELIARIVAETPWLKNRQKQLILQPMTRPEHLRAAMAKNGFALLQEDAVCDENRVYTAMLYRYDPLHAPIDATQCYIGALSGKTAEERRYLKRQADFLQKRIAGFLHAQQQEEADRLQAILLQLQKCIQE
ncbi:MULTISPECIES: class I SAM-dependent methyltransferase [Caproicibacterium]|uniref:Class I SAM-dependent methyltransferase n=1 Tax=Caproicibacterium argilliputei TaxID=3030016 RepID=A0AA97DDP4_9FIRM|nr:class I SAM-dependent methyltransferase [Caproicibacterium argilliputei]WOC33610.1 class I SAM-dependent methyltransferase [Caproicibacterium argilliputei]